MKSTVVNGKKRLKINGKKKGKKEKQFLIQVCINLCPVVAVAVGRWVLLVGIWCGDSDALTNACRVVLVDVKFPCEW